MTASSRSECDRWQVHSGQYGMQAIILIIMPPFRERPQSRHQHNPSTFRKVYKYSAFTYTYFIQSVNAQVNFKRAILIFHLHLDPAFDAFSSTFCAQFGCIPTTMVEAPVQQQQQRRLEYLIHD